MNMAHSDLSECAICTGNSSGVIQQTLNKKDKRYGIQIKGLDSAFITADNIETGYENQIPLWLFGLIY
jgi:hypothetical protein